MTSALTIAGIRFSDDVPAMRRYLEAIGLATTTTRGEDWAVLRAGAGQIWLHSAASSDIGAPPGSTGFSGQIDDVEALAAAAVAAGFPASVVDEAFGRSVEITDPLGARVTVHDHSDDYGYQQHDARPDPGITVSLCRFTDPQGAYAGFAEALGLRREGEPNEFYVPYSAGAGILGLHHDDGSARLAPTPEAEVTLGLTATTPLEQVQQRLRDAGYAPGEIVTEEHGAHLPTTDPDGVELIVHAA